MRKTATLVSPGAPITEEEEWNNGGRRTGEPRLAFSLPSEAILSPTSPVHVVHVVHAVHALHLKGLKARNVIARAKASPASAGPGNPFR